MYELKKVFCYVVFIENSHELITVKMFQFFSDLLQVVVEVCPLYYNKNTLICI